MVGPTLHHEAVGDATTDDRWMYLLHGIYGAGRNWRSVARRLARRRPGWTALLVDLRMHGESAGFEGPHTLSACVSDLEALERSTGRPPSALLGHSFGGKVVLKAVEERGAAEDADGLRQAWVVDSTPAAREPGGSAVRMLEAVRALPDRFGARDEAVRGLEAQGFPRPVARWMTTNLERDDGGFRWAFDWEAMEELLDDFFSTDLWSVVEDPPVGWEVRFVKAQDSRVLPEEACERIERAGRRTGRAFLHRIPGGHWLNADNPEGMVELLAERMT